MAPFLSISLSHRFSLPAAMIFSTAPAEAPRDEVLQRTAVVQHHGITVDPNLGAGNGTLYPWNMIK